ncbi:MAG: sterol desaturase family protein [Rhizobacter sp.]
MGRRKVEQGQGMNLVSLEHGRAGYWSDFALYGAVVTGLSTALVWASPRSLWEENAALVLLGLGLCSLGEYMFHRFVLHGLQPFRRWHARHHVSPRALISAPTVLSASLIAAFIFAPALWLVGPWPATALTLGVITGYLAYALVHHATHHWRAKSIWLKQRKRWHALHHNVQAECCYGVTTGLWDHVFGTARPHRVGNRQRASVGQRTYSARLGEHHSSVRAPVQCKTDE